MPKFEFAAWGIAVLSSSLTCCLLLQTIGKAQWSGSTPPPAKEDSDPIESGPIKKSYRRFHQRYDREKCEWLNFDPRKESDSNESIIFEVYHRHHDRNSRPIETLVEIKSASLRDVLQGCLPRIDSAFDSVPMVCVCALRLR